MQGLDNSQTMLIAQLVIGALLLVFGRKVFWLFVGGLGFLAGMTLASRFIEGGSGTMLLIFGLIGGLIGAGVAVFIQKIAVAVAGFLGGGFLGYFVAHLLGIQADGFPWIPVLICGVLGILFATYVFKWALTILSSVVGSYMIVNAFSLPVFLATILFVVLVVVGLIIQTRMDRKKKPEAELAG